MVIPTHEEVGCERRDGILPRFIDFGPDSGPGWCNDPDGRGVGYSSVGLQELSVLECRLFVLLKWMNTEEPNSSTGPLVNVDDNADLNEHLPDSSTADRCSRHSSLDQRQSITVSHDLTIDNSGCWMSMIE